jgi:uncharacterized membrane protein YphA (DoxX/SURF4 family)
MPAEEEGGPDEDARTLEGGLETHPERRRSMMTNIRQANRRDAAFQGYLLLRIGFVIAPILFGLDKFFNLTVDWPDYLAPWIDRIVPGSAQEFMFVVGVIEIAAGIAVLLSPRWGSLIVAAWLAGIVVNLLTAEPFEYYDIALRDFGLFLGALALNRLATVFGTTSTASEPHEVRRAA